MFFLFYFSLRRLDAASIPANVANPNPAKPVLVSVVPVFANLLTWVFAFGWTGVTFGPFSGVSFGCSCFGSGFDSGFGSGFGSWFGCGCGFAM